MLKDNHTKFGDLEPGKNENRPSYVVRLNNAYVDHNLGDKSDPILWEKQKNRAVRDQFFKGAKIPEHIRNMLATCLDLDEIVLCVETELRKTRNEPQRAPFPQQPKTAPRQFQQERQFAPIGQTQQQNRFPGQNLVQQQGRNYSTSGNWSQQPRGPIRPPYQQQQQQRQQPLQQQQQRTSPQTTQPRSPQQQRGIQSQNSAFQQRQSLNPNAPPYSRNSETNHAQINALMDEVRNNVQRHALTNDHGNEGRESEQ